MTSESIHFLHSEIEALPYLSQWWLSAYHDQSQRESSVYHSPIPMPCYCICIDPPEPEKPSDYLTEEEFTILKKDEKFIKWRNNINPDTNRKITNKGKTWIAIGNKYGWDAYYDIPDDYNDYVQPHLIAQRAYNKALIEYNKDLVKYKKELVHTAELNDRRMKLPWNKYMVRDNCKHSTADHRYGKDFVKDGIHLENDCMGTISCYDYTSGRKDRCDKHVYRIRGSNHVCTCMREVLATCSKCGVIGTGKGIKWVK